jgi:osmotically-inducible protein OsmY
MIDKQLERDVIDELTWDPKIDSHAVDVFVANGTITLRGAVGSFRQKREAQKAAQRVYGVALVSNELDVRIHTDDRREDIDLRAYVLRALTLAVLVPTTVEANVTSGIVTLTGTADWQYQRDEAEFAAGNVRSVIGVENDICLTSLIPCADNLEASIKDALARNAKLDADNLRVRTVNRTAILAGCVRSWAERDAAVSAAWAAPGLMGVDDRIDVDY